LSQSYFLPPFVVFEGVDGTGKTFFSGKLATYYKMTNPSIKLYAGSFPGHTPGTLGEWVYRLHHDEVTSPSKQSIAPAALQLLHVAAHIDILLSYILPTLHEQNGAVILDRFWWSTYAYARQNMDPIHAWSLVHATKTFFAQVAAPVIIFLTRTRSLKPEHLIDSQHLQLDSFYREVIAQEKAENKLVHEINNDKEQEVAWRTILSALSLPYHPIS
jgi:thymidylate kinase